MRKFILSAAAAGALAFAGAASAQDIGTVLNGIFGTPSYPAYSGLPGVLAGTQPYGPVYTDPYGRAVTIDQYGRQVLLQSAQPITGYDAWGRPIFGQNNGAVRERLRQPRATVLGDNDGDGIANSVDRWPDNPNYW